MTAIDTAPAPVTGPATEVYVWTTPDGQRKYTVIDKITPPGYMDRCISFELWTDDK